MFTHKLGNMLSVNWARVIKTSRGEREATREKDIVSLHSDAFFKIFAESLVRGLTILAPETSVL